jgi:hypothetical protein
MRGWSDIVEQRRWLPTVLAVLLCGGITLSFLLFFPGIMNYDARYVYLDSLRGFYGDWQSPVMTWLWRMIDPVLPGSASMFLLINVLYWAGVGTLTIALTRRSPALAIIFLLIAMTPPLLAFVGVIWRDVLMAACWLYAATRTFAETDRSVAPRTVPIVAIALVVLGVLIRPNALAAAPLLITYVLWPHEFSWKRTALLFVPIMVALFAIMQLVYYGALNATRQHPLHSIVVFDLGGITYFSGENQFPVTWSADEMEALRDRCYDPSIWNVYWNGDCKFVMAKVEHEQKLFGTPALSRAWLEAVVKNPLAYVQHRLSFFKSFLFGSHLGMWTMDIDHPPKTVFENRPHFMAFKRLHDALQPTPLFRIGTWFAACLLLCALGWRRRTTPEGAFILGVCGSGALYVLSYLPLGVASEFRYIYWAVLASTAGLMVVLLPKNDAKVTSAKGMTAA